MNRLKKTKFWIIPLVLIVGITLLFRSGVFASKDKTKVVDNSLSVKVTEAQQVDLVPSLTFTGSLEGQVSATVSAKISGLIEEVFVQEGQQVKVGDPLVRLGTVELANAARQAGDAVNKAQANYELALNDFNRYQTLYEKGATSEQQLDNARAKLKTAQADLSSATANQSSSEQQYSYGVISSPVDGLIANKTATVGQVVSPGLALMTVQDINQVYAVVNVEQKELGRVKIGQKANVTIDAYPGKVFSGVVDIMNPEAGSASRMFRVKIKIDNASGELKPGMFAKVQLTTGNNYKVITVPQAAVLQKQGINYVFVLESGKAIRHQVEIGEISENTIIIKSGLQPGEQVIINSVNRLNDGDAVKVTQ